MKLRRIIAKALAALMVALMPMATLSALAAYDMPYYIVVDLTNQITTVYSTKSDVIVRQMICSTGVEHATPTGKYYLPEKQEDSEREEWYYFRMYDCYAQYATRIFKGVLFHSLPCKAPTESAVSATAIAALGKEASHGCVRLKWQDAEFIAKCCMPGTRVRIYNSKKPDEELRTLLLADSYTNEKGMTYDEFLGVSGEEGVMDRSSRGMEVTSLQTRLRDLGIYKAEIDGKYNSATVNAVRQAQRLLGVAESGVADAEFLNTIYAADAPTAQNVTIQEGMSGPVVRNLQGYLADLKLYDGAIDGVFDVDVLEAAKRFQSAYNFRADGVLSPAVQMALYYEAGRVRSFFSEESGYTMTSVENEVTMGKVAINATIRLREKPTGSSSALNRLEKGNLVMALEKSGQWMRVKRGIDTGYVKNEFMEFYTQNIGKLTYTGQDSGKVLTIGCTADEYLAGARFPCEVFGEYVTGGGSLDEYKSLEPMVHVNTDGPGMSLRLRQSPSTESAVLAELPYQAEARLLLKDSEWTLVDYEGQTGYLLNQYLTFDETADEATANGKSVTGDNSVLAAMVKSSSGHRAEVYDVDSPDATVLGKLKNGTRVIVMETVDGWSHIAMQGHIGYMKDEDLQFLLAEDV